jgi:hypothetical protein
MKRDRLGLLLSRGRSSFTSGRFAFACRPLSVIALLLLAAVFNGPYAKAEVTIDAAFYESLEENGLVFQEATLRDYEVTAVAENPHMNYELAIRHKTLPLEIRYAIRNYHIDPNFKSPTYAADDNRASFFVTLLNVGTPTNSADPVSAILNSVEFDSAAVKNDFNADWGGSALVIPKTEFSGGFNRCVVVSIYRRRTGVYIFYLFNKETLEQTLAAQQDVFTALRFR